MAAPLRKADHTVKGSFHYVRDDIDKDAVRRWALANEARLCLLLRAHASWQEWLGQQGS